jgi:hypothetical protein
MQILLVLSILIFGFTALADGAECTRLITHHENTQISRDYWTDSETCFSSVHPRDAYTNLIYRDYLITSEGLLMVFNSYGPGDNAKTTGAREFYFFPRKDKKVEFQHDPGRQEIMVKVTDRLSFVFDTKTAQIKGISEGSLIVDQRLRFKVIMVCGSTSDFP